MGYMRLRAFRKLYRWGESRAGWVLLAGSIAAAGYNWLKWRADRRRQREICSPQTQLPLPGDAEQIPRVSILLPAWNEAGTLETCLNALERLRYPNVEIVLCAGGQDATFAIAQRHARPGVVVLEQHPGEGKQGALRRSFPAATGEIIFLTDADCLLDDETFERTLAPILAGEDVAVTGAWEPREQQRSLPLVQYQWAHHAYRELWMPDEAPALDGRNAAVRRIPLEKAGAFEVEAPIGTDLAQSKQLQAAGYAIRFARGSRVQTDYPTTLKAYRKQRSRWFRNPLVTEEHWLASPSARSVLREGLAATVLALAAGLAPFSALIRNVWLSGVFHLILAQLRMQAVLIQHHDPRVTITSSLLTLVYLPVGWWITIRELLTMLFRSEWDKW